MRYFIAGNLWLFLSLVLFLGRHTEKVRIPGIPRTMRVSFLGFGFSFSPSGYTMILILCLIVAGVLFFLSWRTTRRE